MRKPKPKGRHWMAVAKPARNRRSIEHMLMELKQRLREISDLTAAGDVLNWDQATYMPPGGVDGRSRQCATLYSLAHERAVVPALGRLLDTLAHYGESLPHDSDDASLIRVARRDFQKMIKITARPCRAGERPRLSFIRRMEASAAGEQLFGHGALSRTDA